MRRGLIWSLAAIIVVAVVALGVTIGSGHAPVLGLDLRGGVQVVLRPQGTADKATLQEAVNIIEQRVNGLGVSNTNIERQGHDVVVSLPGVKDPQRPLAVLEERAELLFRPVLCQIASYAPSTTTPATTAPPTSAPKALGGPAASAVELSAGRAAPSGDAGSPPGAPATTAPSTAATTATTTTPATITTTPAGGTSSTAGSGGAALTPAQAQAACSNANAASLPSTSSLNDVATADVILPTHGALGRYVLGPADMKGSAVKSASVQAPSSSSPQYSVQLTLTSSGAAEFDKIAAQRYPYFKQNATTPDPRNLEAIEVDGVVQSAPQIEASSFNGVASITGNFTASQANDLAVALRYGSLPVTFVPQSVQTVSASIGKDSLTAGIAAGVVGIIIVLLYMILYYRALGLVVVVGLGVGGAILYSLITQLSQTSGLALTLSGVTGIIVSVGITVDSYIVYFERLKDEIRAGRTIRQSVERSFARAFRTVLTADFVTVLAALILYVLTVGDVRGFAFMLGLSTLLDVVTAFFFIRPAVILVGRRRAFTEARFIGVARGLGAGRVRV